MYIGILALFSLGSEGCGLEGLLHETKNNKLEVEIDIFGAG
jgi:hypothetical protein